MKRKEVLTTGEVARICHVAPRTVSKWFDSGKLRGYRIPGSRDRRIPLGQLVQFMRAHGMPLRALEGNTIRVLVVDPDRPRAVAVRRDLAKTDRYEVRTAVNDFEVGMQAERFRPHVIFIDVVAESIDANEILRNLRDNPDLAAAKLVALAGPLTRGQMDTLLRGGFDLALSRPYQLAELMGVVEKATDLMA